VHDLLAPCIYEGEGEMLGLAFFKSLVKDHGRRYFEPIGKTLQATGIRRPNLANPAHLWTLREPLWNYSKWRFGKMLHTGRPRFQDLAPALWPHAEWSAGFLQDAAIEVSATMRKHQLKLADRQCRMAELSKRIQTAVVILCTSLYAGSQSDERIRKAGELLARRLTAELTGRRPSDAYLRAVTELGAELADHDLPGTSDILERPILMPYDAEAGT